MSKNLPDYSTILENPEVQSVLEIAEELVRNNKVIQSDLLYKIAKRRLKYSSERLFSIINSLFQNQILVEGSKFTRISILFNEYRGKIYELIKTYPGLHFSIIKEKIFGNGDNSSGSTGQFVWHLEGLIKFNYIKRISVSKYSLFLPVEMEDDFGILFFWLRDRINLKIILLLRNNEPIEQAQIPKDTKESKGNVYYHIKTMIELKILSSGKNADTGKTEVWLNPEKRDLFIQISKTIEETSI